MAFYEAFDAAAFCLQAQQLLMQQDWPAGLAEKSDEALDSPLGVKPEGSMENQQGGSHVLWGRSGGTLPSLLCIAPPPLTLFTAPPPHSLSLTASPPSLSFPYSTPPLTLFPLQHPPTHSLSLTAPPLSFSPTSGLQCRPLAVAHPLSLFLTRLWLAVSAFGNGLLSLKSSWTHSATAASGPLFHGLCVRMGISTGMLLPGEHALGSQIMSQAKEVSDAGAGGQVGRAGGQVGWGVRLELGGR